MPDDGPVYIDFYGRGGGGRGGPPEPFWKAAWRGREALWKVFWGAFVFGHGLLIAFGLGTMTLATLVGLVASPTNFDAAALPAGVVGVIVGVLSLAYLTWASVAVWRCAFNSIDRNWGIWARVVLVVYWGSIAYLVVRGVSG